MGFGGLGFRVWGLGFRVPFIHEGDGKPIQQQISLPTLPLNCFFSFPPFLETLDPRNPRTYKGACSRV